MKSIRTPLGVVRGHGSAKHGTGEFIVIRATGIVLLALLTIFIIVIVALNGQPYETVVSALSSPFVAIVLLAGIVLTTVHMKIGMQEIIEDYVQDEMLKVAALVGNWVFSWGCGVTAAFAVLKIAFGGG